MFFTAYILCSLSQAQNWTTNQIKILANPGLA